LEVFAKLENGQMASPPAGTQPKHRHDVWLGTWVRLIGPAHRGRAQSRSADAGLTPLSVAYWKPVVFKPRGIVMATLRMQRLIARAVPELLLNRVRPPDAPVAPALRA
jgi:hypothetical protein